MNLNTLAAYATILSAGILIGGGVVGAVWRVWTWRQEHGTNVTVRISLGFLTLSLEPHVIEAVIVTAINSSAHAVRVTSAGVEMNDGTKRNGFVPLKPGAGIPGTIQAHDQAMTWLEKAELEKEGFDVFRKARAFVLLADREGGAIWSKPRRLMRRSKGNA
jgi:hypothetical protein